MKLLPFNFSGGLRLGYLLGAWRGRVASALTCGPVVCLRLAAAAAFGLLAAVAFVLFCLLALVLLVPAAVLVIVLGGSGLLAWPFSSTPAPVEAAAS